MTACISVWDWVRAADLDLPVLCTPVRTTPSLQLTVQLYRYLRLPARSDLMGLSPYTCTYAMRWRTCFSALSLAPRLQIYSNRRRRNVVPIMPTPYDDWVILPSVLCAAARITYATQNYSYRLHRSAVHRATMMIFFKKYLNLPISKYEDVYPQANG